MQLKISNLSKTYSNGVNSQVATYNSGAALCNQTPTQNRTWGQVKSLYR